jgi:hypothetical protein
MAYFRKSLFILLDMIGSPWLEVRYKQRVAQLENYARRLPEFLAIVATLSSNCCGPTNPARLRQRWNRDFRPR